MTKVAVFQDPTGDSWMKWYARELSTAMLVNNLTLCFPLFLSMYRRVMSRVSTIRNLRAQGPRATSPKSESTQVPREEGEGWANL